MSVLDDWDYRLRMPSVGAWRHLETLAEDCCKILTGVEAAAKGDLSDRALGDLPDFFRSVINTTLVEVIDASGINEGSAVTAEGSYSHATLIGHLWQGPWLSSNAGLLRQSSQKEFHRALT